MVAPRPYRMVERAQSVAQTRSDILMAAHALFAGEGFADVSVDDVASAAGVSRGTVYHQFGSRSGLIEALTTATEEPAGYLRILEVSAQPDPAAALVDTLVEAVRFVDRTRPLFDNLRALAHVEPDTRRMVERKDAARRTLVSELVARADDAGLLTNTLTPRGATALLVGVTTYESIRELLDAAGSVDEAQQVMRWTAFQVLGPAAEGRIC